MLLVRRRKKLPSYLYKGSQIAGRLIMMKVTNQRIRLSLCQALRVLYAVDLCLYVFIFINYYFLFVGIGKSSFLANYPDSKACEAYMRSHSPDQPSPIVMMFTFNSRMEDDSGVMLPAPGLRALFGVVSVMCREGAERDSEPLTYPWSSFREEFLKYESLTVYEAINISRRLYGENRRVLVLVDELSKARPEGVGDKQVMRELGYVLNHCDFADVIVSSLSIEYVINLVSGSQRPIEYVPMPPMVDAGLGEEETEAWARNLTGGEMGKMKHVYNILKSVHLLASGHPRSIEYLLRSYETNMQWQEVIKCIRNNCTGAMIFSKVLKATNLIFPSGLLETGLRGTLEKEQAIELVLDTLCQDPTRLREFSERGAVYVTKVSGQSCMRLGDFLAELSDRKQLYTTLDFPFSNLSKAAKLYIGLARAPYTRSTLTIMTSIPASSDELFIKDKLVSEDAALDLSYLWELSVALTIVSRAEASQNIDVIDVFCIPDISTCPSLSVRCAAHEGDLAISSDQVCNELVVPPQYFSGFDARITFVRSSGEPVFIYGQIKIAAPSLPLAKVCVKSIVSTLLHHFRTHGSRFQECVADIHLAFYIWIDLPEPTATVSEVIALLPSYLSGPKTVKLLGPSPSECKAIIDFMSTYGMTNIHLIGMAQLDEWLIPTLRPVPRFTVSVGGSTLKRS